MAATAAAISAPFQSLLEFSALSANPAAAQTQAALISAILQANSNPATYPADPNQLGSLLANSALAAVIQATANALTNGSFGAQAAAALESLTNGKSGLVDDFDGTTNGSNGFHPHHNNKTMLNSSYSQEECANCGTVSVTTHRRMGHLAHYLCAKCGPAHQPQVMTSAHQQIPGAVLQQQQQPQQQRKKSDANSSDGGESDGKKTTASGRKVGFGVWCL